nr:hypothetical protein [Tanacetum cinerariifolium]
MNSNDLSDIHEYHTQLDMEQYTQYLEYFEQYEAMEEDEAESSVKHTRRYIARDRELTEDKLQRDYFGDENTPPVYPEEYFRRSVSRFHVAFSPTISAGGGGARGENVTHGVILAPWGDVFADDSSHGAAYLVL